MGAAKPGPVPKVHVMPKRSNAPVMPDGLTAAQQEAWREAASNPWLTEADYPLLDEFVEIMRVRDAARASFEAYGSTMFINNRGNASMHPQYKVWKEQSEALIKLRERMLLTPQSRLKAGKVDEPGEGDDEIETD